MLAVPRLNLRYEYTDRTFMCQVAGLADGRTGSSPHFMPWGNLPAGRGAKCRWNGGSEEGGMPFVDLALPQATLTRRAALLR